MGKSKKKRRLGAWLLALVMVCSLITVPAKSVEAAEVSYALTVKDGYSSTSVTMAKNQWGADIIGDVLFNIPQEAATQDALASSGITKMEVTLTVSSFTSGGGASPKVMAYVQPGEDGGWEWNQSEAVELESGKQLTVTYDLSGMKWNNGSTMGNMGIRFANCADGSKVSFTINSAKLIGQAWDVENEDISLSYTGQDQYNAYTEYKFTIKNDGNTPANGDLVITFDKQREKNWWTENFSINLSNDGKTLTVSGVSVPAGGSSDAIQVQLKPMGAAITSVSFAGKTISASGTTLGATGGGGGGSTTDDFTGSITYTVPDNCVDDAVETPLDKHGKLHVDMKTLKLTDANGNPYQLRGISSHGINWDGNGEYEYEYINFNSIKNVRDILNADAIRLAMYTAEYHGYTTDGNKNQLKYRVDKGVQCATALGMYAIVDWHILNANPKNNVNEAKEFFEYVSKRYSSYDNVLYEICNEPTSGIWSDIKTYAETIVPVIKKNDPDAVIIVGTPTWSQDVEIAADNPLKDADGTLMDNVLYTIHFYANEHKDSYRSKLKSALNRIPIFCTEYGMTPASGDGANNFPEATTWLNLLDENCISYFVWNLSEKPESSSLIMNGSNTWDSWTANNLSESGKWIKEQYALRKTINNSAGVSVDSVTLNKTSLTLKEGESEILEATVEPSGIARWTSDKPSVAMVDNSGKVTAVGVGTAQITATAGGKSAVCTVTVTAKPVAVLAADDVSLETTYGDDVTAKTVTINNTGEAEAQSVSAALESGARMALSTGSLAAIAAGGKADIQITPKERLNAGTYEDTIVVTYNNGKGKTTLSIPVSLKVNKRSITIKAKDQEKVYGEENPEWDYEVTSSGKLVDGDVLDLAYSTTATQASDAGTYPIEISAGSDPNYTISTAAGTLTVKKKPVTKVAFPNASAITVGDSLEASELTGGDDKYGTFAWVDSTLVLGEDAESADVVLTLNEQAKKNYSFEGIVGYEASKDTITAQVEIWVKAANTPDIVFPTVVKPQQFGQKLEDIDLTGGSTEYGTFTWKDENITLTEIGDVWFDVTFTPNIDAVSTYKMRVITRSVKVTVEKADNPDTPDAPELVKRTSATIQVKAAEGYEYSKDGGETWQSKNTFTGLSAFTKYSIIARIKETETKKSSENSDALTVYTLVEDPYVIDVSKLDDSNYIDALCKADGTATIEYSTNTLTLKESGESYTITGSNPSVTIQAAADSKITLSGATVKAVKVPGKATIAITGNNKVTDTISSDGAGIITVSGTGTLDTSGIISTGTNGSVTIKSGTLNIDASGTDHAAIKAPTIVIEGGTVTAIGGSGSPAITGDDITISGGTVTATSGSGSPAIAGDDITISGGTVTAIGGNGASAISGGEVRIEDGAVTATGGAGASAISGTNVSMKDSTVTADAGEGASAIESTGQIKIDDSQVEVKVEEGSDKSAISSDDIVITGTTTVSSPNKDVNLYSSTPKDENGKELTDKQLVTKITLDSTSKTIKVGDKVTLKATVEPSDATDSSVTWSSSNTKAATVDQKGNVTAVAAGTAVITVTAKDGSGKSAACTIKVEEKDKEDKDDKDDKQDEKVERIKITGATKKVAPGKKITLKAEVYPENAANKAVKWTVNNSKYASVNSKGVVTTKKAGKGKKVTVTATSLEDGSIKAVYKISIMKNAVKKIKLSAKKTTLKKKQSVTIKAKFTPSKGISKELTWTSSNPKVATVNAKGKVVAKKKGKTKITAKAKDGSGKKATITIKVK
ncbi:MAG: Ig-like domain-containing protein [Clostridium sp.]|nr:Ig-like domain-containing protein [Clostridium sp.]